MPPLARYAPIPEEPTPDESRHDTRGDSHDDSRDASRDDSREESRFSRMRRFRAARRKARGLSKDFVLAKVGLFAGVIALYLLMFGVSSWSTGGLDGGGLERVTRETEGNKSVNHAPWEECGMETQSTARRVGFIVLWLALIIWIFIGLAVICDDFFVPSLEAISEKLNLTEDVAGATFMAAGSSAPELFTSIAGVSFESDVGVGTIVGSAIFNLLIIIALSAALSTKVLNLDWRPLARDSIFYGISIICFIGFAWDGQIDVWDAAILFFFYCVYVSVMFVNQPLMRLLAHLGQCCPKVGPEDDEDDLKKDNDHLEIHQFHHHPQLIPGGSKRNSIDVQAIGAGENAVKEEEEESEGIVLLPFMPAVPMEVPSKEGEGALAVLRLVGSWLLFVLAFPWCLLLAYTVPNCGKPHLKKWFLVSFIMSVFWIAFCSFGMVFLVGRTGCAMTIKPFIMGLIIVAIGTSVPDALSSVIVARDGFGDMAVSNAIGSNVFDINLGIGLPSLIRIASDGGAPIVLLDEELEKHQDAYPNNPFIPHVKFGFILLFVLLLCLLIFVLVRFRLNRVVGASFLLMYILFIVYAIVQEFACHKGFAC